METKNKEGDRKTSDFFKVKGDWNKQSKALKEKYPELTSEDIKFESGKETDLFKRLETRLDKNCTKVIGILKNNQDASC